MSKDTDILYSHLLHQKPWELVLVHTGNIVVHDLHALFAKHLVTILSDPDYRQEPLGREFPVRWA